MKKYLDYEASSIRWNQDKPKHWKCDKAKRFFLNPKQLNKGNVEKNILSLTLHGVIRNNADNPIGLSPADYSTYQIFDMDDLVFKLIDLENISTSRVGIVPEKGIMSSAYIRLKAKQKCNIKYFYYQYFDWYKRNIFNGLGAGVRQTLSATDLLNLDILIPPLNEQTQIVNYLDWQILQINNLISLKRKQIRLLKERASAFISKAIFGEFESALRKNSGVEWVGDIPEDWITLRCKYLFRERDERSKEGKEQHLSMSQKYGLIPDSQLDERRMLSESYAGGKLCYKDDLVLNRLKAHLGVFSLSPQLGVISPDYTVLIPNLDRIVPEYVETVLKSDRCRGELRIRVKGVTEGFWRLYTDDFNTIILPVPPIDVQKDIMERINAFKLQTKHYIDSILHEVDVLHELKYKLISDVVTGQIDIRNIEIPEYVFEDESEDNNDSEGNQKEG